MQGSLGKRLKAAREKAGLSQNEAATIIHVSRQSFSKWENDHGYPDLDNLVYISDLYGVTVDSLLKGSVDDTTIQANKTQRKTTSVKLSPKLYQNRDEGLFLLVLAFVSGIVPPVGIVLPIYIMWRNNKYNSLYKVIYLVSVIMIIVSAIGTSVYVSDNWLSPTQTTVYRVK